jgi:hypothetical protein
VPVSVVCWPFSWVSSASVLDPFRSVPNGRNLQVSRLHGDTTSADSSKIKIFFITYSNLQL